MDGPDSSQPVVAKEAMKDSRRVEASHDETANVRDQSNRGPQQAQGNSTRGRRRGTRSGSSGCHRRRVSLLEGQEDVDTGGHSLNGNAVLGMVDKIAEAGLELGIPLEDVKL